MLLLPTSQLPLPPASLALPTASTESMEVTSAPVFQQSGRGPSLKPRKTKKKKLAAKTRYERVVPRDESHDDNSDADYFPAGVPRAARRPREEPAP